MTRTILVGHADDVGKFQRRELNKKDYIKRSANESDFDNLIKEDFILYEKGQPLIVYLKIPEIENAKFLEVLKRIKFPKGAMRTTGLTSQSKIFGYSPRETIRKDYCSSTALSAEDPEGHRLICDFAADLSKYYKLHCPQMYDYHRRLIQGNILPEWMIEDSVFTSGIINKNNLLKYHKDVGNIANVFSNMICFKKDCTGGHLSIPEFNIGLEIADRTMLFFDGQSIIHGVTPFKITSTQGYRYTLVYYTLQKMWRCEPVEVELDRIKHRKTDREKRRADRLKHE
jgi:2-oxoglutarate-Fe(II)-dependent dioxygenase family protein